MRSARPTKILSALKYMWTMCENQTNKLTNRWTNARDYITSAEGRDNKVNNIVTLDVASKLYWRQDILVLKTHRVL